MLLDVLLAGLTILHLIALPIFLIALADNKQRADRLRFGVAFLFAALATAAIATVDWGDRPRYDPGIYPRVEFPIARLGANLLWLAAYAWFGRVTVQRLNAIGRSKKLAFLLLVPYVNFAFATYLLFARIRPAQRLPAE